LASVASDFCFCAIGRKLLIAGSKKVEVLSK
jgi:hypothetical protein